MDCSLCGGGRPHTAFTVYISLVFSRRTHTAHGSRDGLSRGETERSLLDAQETPALSQTSVRLVFKSINCIGNVWDARIPRNLPPGERCFVPLPVARSACVGMASLNETPPASYSRWFLALDPACYEYSDTLS